MSRWRKMMLACLLILTFPVVACACLWDYDTLQMERQRFPSTLELITGKFLRHSPEFYQWRIQDRLSRLEKEPENLALYDDLAVAYDKTGQQALAIETMLKKNKLSPGLYETEANLGTFLIHGGKLSEGLEHIKQAIEINPDAHFGREKYQQLLVEYVLSRQVDEKTKLPLARIEWSQNANNGRRFVKTKQGFAEFLALKLPNAFTRRHWKDRERVATLKGLLGIMKFGNYESPIVLEALGDVLSLGDHDNADAKQLAARAYLKAEMEVKDPEVKQVYHDLALNALSTKTMSLDELSEQFQSELADAKAWYGNLREQELQWIREGLNADLEFDRLYVAEPEIESPALRIETSAQTVQQPNAASISVPSYPPTPFTRDSLFVRIMMVAPPLFLGFVVIAVLSKYFWLRRSRHEKKPLASASPYERP